MGYKMRNVQRETKCLRTSICYATCFVLWECLVLLDKPFALRSHKMKYTDLHLYTLE